MKSPETVAEYLLACEALQALGQPKPGVEADWRAAAKAADAAYVAARRDGWTTEELTAAWDARFGKPKESETKP